MLRAIQLPPLASKPLIWSPGLIKSPNFSHTCTTPACSKATHVVLPHSNRHVPPNPTEPRHTRTPQTPGTEPQDRSSKADASLPQNHAAPLHPRQRRRPLLRRPVPAPPRRPPRGGGPRRHDRAAVAALDGVPHELQLPPPPGACMRPRPGRLTYRRRPGPTASVHQSPHTTVQAARSTTCHVLHTSHTHPSTPTPQHPTPTHRCSRAGPRPSPRTRRWCTPRCTGAASAGTLLGRTTGPRRAPS